MSQVNKATTQVKVNPAKPAFDLKGLQASAKAGIAVTGSTGARADLNMRLTYGADLAAHLESDDYAKSARQLKLIPVCYLHLVEQSGSEIVTMGELNNLVLPFVVKVAWSPVNDPLGQQLWAGPTGKGYVQDIAQVWGSTYGAALLGKTAGYGSKRDRESELMVQQMDWSTCYEVFRIVG